MSLLLRGRWDPEASEQVRAEAVLGRADWEALLRRARIEGLGPLLYNVVGGLLWIWSMLLTGYYVVKLVPGLEHHVEKLIIGIILLSIAPGIYGWWKARRNRSAAAGWWVHCAGRSLTAPSGAGRRAASAADAAGS